MPLEPLLLSYAGLASLAAATQRMRNGLRWKLPNAMLMKIVGALLLLAALWRAVVRFGPYQGPVAWTGLLCLSGTAMVLLSSRWKTPALIAGVLAVAIAAIFIAMPSGT